MIKRNNQSLNRRLDAYIARILCALIVLCLTLNAQIFDWQAFHRSNDKEWALKSHLSADQVRQLRLAAGIEDNEPSNPIDAIQVLAGGRFLLATAAGSGHCLTVSVYKKKGDSFRQVWSANHMPDGTGFCHPSLCPNPKVWVTAKREIVVSIPLPASGSGCDEDILLTYRRHKETYEVVNEERQAVSCAFNYYYDALRNAFVERLRSNFLVSVQVLPSFQPSYIVAIQQEDDHFLVSRMEFPRARLEPASTLHLCVRDAESYVRSAQLSSSQLSECRKLVDEFHHIDLNDTDQCPRGTDGLCAGVLDGTEYYVESSDGRVLKVTDTSGLGIRSENPRLLNWIRKFLSAAH